MITTCNETVTPEDTTMNVYRIECVVKRIVRQYIQAETKEDALKQLRELEDVDKVIKIELDQ